MDAKRCDDCGTFYEERDRSTYYYVRDGKSSFVSLAINLDLCDKCWNKMLKEVSKNLEIETKEHR